MNRCSLLACSPCYHLKIPQKCQVAVTGRPWFPKHTPALFAYGTYSRLVPRAVLTHFPVVRGTRQANGGHGLTGSTRKWPRAAKEKRGCSGVHRRLGGRRIRAWLRSRGPGSNRCHPRCTSLQISGARFTTISTEERKCITCSPVRPGNV